MKTVTNEDWETQFIGKNIGHLSDVAIEIDCPSCHERCLTRVDRQCVASWQKLFSLLNFFCCKILKWHQSHDVNHYCSNCGCFIGRKITLDWARRKILMAQHKSLIKDIEWQKTNNQTNDDNSRSTNPPISSQETARE